jgi:hypothetical protein
MIRIARAPAFAGVLLLAGCVTYSPSQLSAMNTVDMCELEQMQRPNLSAETKSAFQSELQRRGESCAKYSAELEKRYADFMYRETYGKNDNP